MKQNQKNSWSVTKESDGWYYWDDLGNANGPFESEELAGDCLDSYSDGYYGTFEEE